MLYSNVFKFWSCGGLYRNSTSHLCVSGTISNTQRWCCKIPKLTILTSFEIIGEAWYSVMISWDGDGERERERYIYIHRVSCLSLDFSNLFMLLSKAAYSSEEQELSIAHVKAVWFFERHFCAVGFKHSLMFPHLVWDTGKCPFVPKQWLEDHHCPINVCGMQKQWEIKVVRCINEWTSFSRQWHGMKSTTWKSHGCHCNEFSNRQPQTQHKSAPYAQKPPLSQFLQAFSCNPA